MPNIVFRNVLDFVCDTFPEARDWIQEDQVPLAPGMPALSSPSPYVKLKQSDLIDYALQQASASLRNSASSSRPSCIPLPPCRAYLGPWGHIKPATLNPDLAAQLRGSLEPRITTTQREVSQLEAGLLASLGIQNSLIWFVGTLVTRLAPAAAASSDAALLDHLLSSINRAFTAQARVSATTLANVRSLRREAFLSALPARYQPASKRTLRSSPMHADYLFGPDQVTEATAMAKEAATFSLSEATARALSRPAPRPGTPLVARPSQRLSYAAASSSTVQARPRTRATSTSQVRFPADSRTSLPPRQSSSRQLAEKRRGSRSFRR